MNKIFSLFLSLSLIIAPVAVQAEEPVNRPADSYTKAGATGSSQGADFYMLQAGMVGLAAFAGSTMACVPGSYHWSHYIFAAGGAAFIGAEIALASQNTDYHKLKKQSLNMDDPLALDQSVTVSKEDRDFQTKSLKALLDEEKNNKEMMESRKKWAEATAIVYDLAVIAAGIEAALSLAPIYSGFAPDYLGCEPVPALAYTVLEILIGAYAINSAVNLTNGKLGLSTVGYALLLRTEAVVVHNLGILSMKSAWGRVGYMGGAAIVANVIKEQLGDKIAIVNSNIRKLETAITTWEEETHETKGVVAGATTPTASSEGAQTAAPPQKNYLVNNVKNTKTPNTKCLSVSASTASYDASSCKNPIKYDPKMPKFDIPEIGMYTKQALDYSNAVVAGDMQKANISADSLIANAAKIKKIKDQVLKDAQAKLDAQGGKKQDLLASIDAHHADMMKQLSEAAQKSGFDTSTAGNKAALDKSSNEKTDAHQVAVTAPTLPKATTPPQIQLYSASDSGGAVTDPTGLTNAEKDLISEDYAQNKNAYLSNDSDSLFEVLTKTYLRNLDRILVKKKKVAQEEAPNPVP